MANQNHLDILKQGVEAWNKWRNENKIIVKPILGIRPDRIEPDFVEADLSYAIPQQKTVFSSRLHIS